MPVASRRSFRRCDILALNQTFLVIIAERPGSRLAISVHLFPCRDCSSNSFCRSSSVKGFRFREGSRWFKNRSRVCSESLPGSCSAIRGQFKPFFRPQTIALSSSALHWVETKPGCSFYKSQEAMVSQSKVVVTRTLSAQ